MAISSLLHPSEATSKITHKGGLGPNYNTAAN